MFDKIGNCYYLIPFMWSDYTEVLKEIFSFGISKGLDSFKLRFTHPTDFLKANQQLSKIVTEKGIEDSEKRIPGYDFWIGKMNKESINLLALQKWRTIGFYSLEIFGENNSKLIQSIDSNELCLQKFSDSEIRELEIRLTKWQVKTE